MDGASRDAVAEIKARLNVEDVVSQYVQLKRAGRNLKGLSPFTNEKTPSFMVSPEKQIWHDFSSNKGGDIFSLVMELEGLDFRGALEHLARQAGIELEQFQSRGAGQGKLKERLVQANELAAKFYQNQLRLNRPAINYLSKTRGLSKKTIVEWRLGWSPAGPKALSDFLLKRGFSLSELKRAGLSVERRDSVIDMFRSRIMIPLSDPSGKVVGFTARLLSDEPNSPKYINTPATLIYDKSRLVFGLDHAKEAIRKSGFSVATEGQMDVIGSHQAGITNVVASAGTAMTEVHLATLKRFSGDIRLCFDADRAGIAATERMIPIAQKLGLELKVISLPGGAKDPDELARSDAKAWQAATEKAKYAMDWLIERYKNELDLSGAAGKRAFTDTLAPTVRRLSDPVEQEHYVKELAKLTDSSIDAVTAKIGAKTEAPIRLKKTAQPILPPTDVLERAKLQNHFLAIVWGEPAARDLAKKLPKDLFEPAELNQLAEFIASRPSGKVTKLSSSLKNLGTNVKILELQFEELYQKLEVDERVHAARLARTRLVGLYIKLKRHELAAKMQGATGNQLTKLIQKADKLNSLTKTLGEVS